MALATNCVSVMWFISGYWIRKKCRMKLDLTGINWIMKSVWHDRWRWGVKKTGVACYLASFLPCFLPCLLGFFLHSFFPSLLASFLPSFPASFLPSLLPCLFFFWMNIFVIQKIIFITSSSIHLFGQNQFGFHFVLKPRVAFLVTVLFCCHWLLYFVNILNFNPYGWYFPQLMFILLVMYHQELEQYRKI